MYRPIRALLSLALLLGSTAQAQEAPAPVEADFLARVSVDASGRVTDTEFVRPVPPELAPLVAAAAATVPFEPATRDGVPVPSRTALALRLRFLPDGDQLRTELLSIEGGATAVVKTRPPAFPASLAGNDFLRLLALVAVTVRADGSVDLDASRVDRVELHRANDEVEAARGGQVRDVRKAIERVLPEWRFIVEEVDGVAVGTTVQVPVTFCVVRRAGGGDGREVCSAWSRRVQAGLAPAAADAPGLRLAQPKVPAAAQPAA